MEKWVVQLTPLEVAELKTACDGLVTSKRDVILTTAKNFPLPTLGPKLLGLRDELIHSCGFFVLRRLPTAKYSGRKAGTIFYERDCHLGLPRSQNAMDHLIGHVRDLGMESNDPEVRIYQTNERQTFHTDSADVVDLLCLKTLTVGGISLLVSASTIFEGMSYVTGTIEF